METNKCKCCKETKPIKEFYWRDKERKVPTTYCKECNKLNTKKWRKTPEGKKKFKSSRDVKITKVREWVNTQRALGCERCEEKRFYVIDFHHIDPNTKKHTLGNQGMFGSWKATKEEIKKCIRLCANCHRELHYLERKELDN
jgi:hypothetical protein